MAPVLSRFTKLVRMAVGPPKCMKGDLIQCIQKKFVFMDLMGMTSLW